MPFDLQRPQQPLIYLITGGETTSETSPTSQNYKSVLRLVESATQAGVDLIQIREKQLSAAVLYQLTESAAAITRGTATRLLVNDRSDIARAAGADGVHLTTSSLPADVVRNTFGNDFLIGVSTHSLSEAIKAREDSADFLVFGPVFATSSKQQYGQPLGAEELAKVASSLKPFPVLALGGVTPERVADCFRAGAAGIAAITMLSAPIGLRDVVNEIRRKFE